MKLIDIMLEVTIKPLRRIIPYPLGATSFKPEVTQHVFCHSNFGRSCGEKFLHKVQVELAEASFLLHVSTEERLYTAGTEAEVMGF